MYGKKYSIEYVLTSHSESYTAYFLIDERTCPISTMEKNIYDNK